MKQSRPIASTVRSGGRTMLLRSASLAVVASAIAVTAPAHAQLAARRSGTLQAPVISTGSGAGQVRTRAQTDALDRQTATRTRAEQIRTYATAARAAAQRSVPNGLQGLVVAEGVTAEALASGALQAARDATGRLTWQGASLPTETVTGTSSLVTINQTESRAILSWQRFDVGADTTLQFNQRVGTVAQKDWVAVNRVVDANAAPSQILGKIKADGTVVVVNRNGVLFGAGAQVSANSLMASSLDIGNFVKAGSRLNPETGNFEAGFVSTTLQDRNIAFLQNGLLSANVSSQGVTLGGMLFSAETTGFFAPSLTSIGTAFNSAPVGTVTVERGASITAGSGGYIILTGPEVLNDGKLFATEGQVSLQAGQAITVTTSTGSASSADRDVRGLILRSPFTGTTSRVVNSGLIESKRGYASLGASLTGSVTNAGLIAATTSISRNGVIELTGGTVTLSGDADPSHAGGLVITPDENGETIPQGTAASPAEFRSSLIRMGAVYLDPLAAATDRIGIVGPGRIQIDRNALILAPSARVEIGGAAGETFSASRFASSAIPDVQAILAASSVTIADGALIDVSGVKDVTIAASRNSLMIDPVKRNELRDTPNYRETNTDGAFTLNGATVYVDPRITGVRDDGVAWVGSPLIEAGSAASQIGVTAAELMTKGGSVNLNVAVLEGASAIEGAPAVTVSSGATIDFSGGWVRYLDGIVRTSRLLTVDGRVVDISAADPNDRFVAIGDGFTETQSRFGVERTYGSSILEGARFEFGYDEGRDAGALLIGASAISLDGTLHGDAFAGLHQLTNALHPTRAATLAGDPRLLQASARQLPSGGYLRIGASDRSGVTELAGDIVLGTAADALPAGAIHLDDTMLSKAGLGALSLRTTGSVTFAQGSNLTLADGGKLVIEAGRSVSLAGNVTAAGGDIAVRTTDFGRDIFGASQGSVGSPFRADDDLASFYAEDPALAPFDITVSGTLSTAGRWTNDFTGTSLFSGGAFIDGGSISLEVAPNVFVGVGGTATAPLAAADLSGRIVIDADALLDVSAGGYVARDGSLDLTGRGGDVSLINRTIYASTSLTDINTSNDSRAAVAIGGTNQSVTFTPYSVDQTRVVSALVPENQRAEVRFETASIRGFGFSGGGTFTLVAPDIAMGSQTGGKGPHIGLDFFQKTGFGTVSLTAYKSRFIRGLFNNGQDGLSAFLDTERFVIGEGETLDLTQTLLPSILDLGTSAKLVALEDGGDIFSVLTPGIATDAWDRQAAHLVLGGMTELDVQAGGTVTGAAGASITAPRLYNAGTIRIAGGSITQIDTLEALLPADRVLGVRDVALGGTGLSAVLGGGVAGQESGFDENALVNAEVFRDSRQTRRVTNGQLFSLVDPFSGGRSLDANVVFTGRVGLDEGIHLASTGVIDLSGTAIYNPRGGFLADGTRLQVGRMVAGGSIVTSRFGSATGASNPLAPSDPANRLVAEAGSRIALDGASGAFDIRVSSDSIERTAQWSNAGSLVLGNGGSIGGATITAFGGDDGDADTTRTRATGGVLDWVSPTIVQSTDALNPGFLSADQVMASGFQTLVARDGFTVQGNVTLELGKAFIATTDTREGTRTTNAMVITAAQNANASIIAPYIRLASSNRRVTGTAASTGAGSITLQAKAIDVVGAVEFNVGLRSDGVTRGSAKLIARDDLRLIGTNGIPDADTGLFAAGLDGQLVSNGDLTLQATQVYATTGTGNLQQLLEQRRAGQTETPSPFVIASSNVDGVVSFLGQPGSVLNTPYSAGTHIAVRGAHIVQDGVLRAPLGMIELGSNQSTPLNNLLSAPATQSLVLGANSLTSVTARTSLTGSDALSIPYGTTTDLIEYFFSPGTSQILTTMPTGQLTLAGADISIQSSDGSAVRVDARGGGDVFAYEFVSGTGGSRDVLDRFNADPFSGNEGLQYADGRQVFALVPASEATVAMYDPIYSADYAGGGGVDIYGLQAGRSVWLDAAPGVAAGEYVLMPAHYALLPGALRIVENVGADALPVGGAITLLDGSQVVSGVFGTAGTDLRESQRRSFTVQTKAVFSKYSNIQTTSGSESAIDQAEHDGLAVPVLPRDAARVVLAPLTTLTASGQFLTDPGKDGRGSQVDIGGARIRIAAAGAVAEPETAGYLLLTTDTLANFNANSLSIGALRSDNADGTTRLSVVSRTITVDNDVVLQAPELLLSVGGLGAALTIEDAVPGTTGAIIRGTGTLSDTRTGDYVINATANPTVAIGSVDNSGVGAVLRVSSGPQRLVTRTGSFLQRNTLTPALLDIGAGASIEGNAIALDSSRNFAIDATVRMGAATAGGAFDLALSSDTLTVGGSMFAPEIQAQMAQARTFTLRSPDVIDFVAGAYDFNNLIIDAAGIGVVPGTGTTSDLVLNADDVELRNSSSDLGGCVQSATRACSGASALTILSDTLTFGGGAFRTYGFGNGVTLSASGGMTVAGSGTFSTVDASGTLNAGLTLATPFIADRNTVDILSEAYARPQFTFAAVGDITVAGTGMAAAAPAINTEAPGTLIAFRNGNDAAGITSDVTFADTLVRASAGTIDVLTNGSIALRGGAKLDAGGYSRIFDGGIDKITVSAGGGLIRLQTSGTGALIDMDATSALIVDNGRGDAGTLLVSASDGAVNFGAQLNTGIASGVSRRASLALDTGSSAFDLSGFAANYGRLFGGDLALRSGSGDLSLAGGQTLRARSISLTADGGSVLIGGTLDTSGDSIAGLKLTDAAYAAAIVDGGNISLFGQDGVTLSGTASLLSRTSGWAAGDSRQARGGDVTIGIGTGATAALTIASGATIDVAATRTGDRVINEVIVDPLTQLESPVARIAAGDLGGTVLLRAPVVSGAVALDQSGSIVGAREQTVEGYRRWDLDAVAASGAFSGVTAGTGGITLDLGAAIAGRSNFLSDYGAGTIVQFIQDFALTDANGNPLSGFRVRPGVELVSQGNVTLGSNWNLAAGQIVNADGTPGYADALAAGLLVESPLGPYTSGPNVGQPRYEVVAGREAELFENYVAMTYRVGSSVRGEAALLSLRAGGNLAITRSISDGFFAFHDFTNADYISYQLGGGNRQYNPALALNCGSFAPSCSDSVLFGDTTSGGTVPANNDRVTITIGTAEVGSETSPYFVNAPYTAQANAAAAGGTGDAFGTAELFPLLRDGSAVHSSDLRLVAGSQIASANPLQVDSSATGSLTVSGETSYRLVATPGTGRVDGTLQLGLGASAASRTYYGIQDVLDLIASGENPELGGDYYTVLDWGSSTTGASAAARAAAQGYAGFSADRFIGDPANPTGVSARLADVVAFLTESGFAQTYAEGIASGQPGFVAATPRTDVVRVQNDTVYVGTLVRTGDGSINMAAAGNIDLRRTGDTVVQRIDPALPANSGVRAQVGANAVYTAGVRASQAYLAGANAPQFTSYPARLIPGPTAGVQVAPVIARDGGDVTLTAGGDVLGRRDAWGQLYGQNGSFLTVPNVSALFARNYPASTSTAGPDFSMFGTNSGDQRWRYGFTSAAETVSGIAFNYFTSGVGALSGGDVSITAGRDISDLTVALDNSLVTTAASGVPTLVSLGGGNLTMRAGRDLRAGEFDIASGKAVAEVRGNVTDAGTISATGAYVVDTRNLMRVRVSDATFDLVAGGSVTIGGAGALGLGRTGTTGLETAGFFSPIAGFSARSLGDITYVGNRPEQYIVQGVGTLLGSVLPPSLRLSSLQGDITFATQGALALPKVLYASRYGQLSLLAAGNIGNAGLAMSDAAPTNFFGSDTYFGTTFPTVTADTPDSVLRQIHNRAITHLGDSEPVRLIAGGSITDLVLSVPKQARVHAGLDIVDLYFSGQNVTDRDATRISAGRDITGTVGVSASGAAQGRSGVLGNTILLGGPGALFVEAGRDLGPFITSAAGSKRAQAGGIITIGNEANPWLGAQGASIYAFFGVGPGMDYTSLQGTYLDPANQSKLDGDLFVQITDESGNARPDRTKFSYAPALANWLSTADPEAYAEIFGATPPTGSALSEAAYAKYAQLYEAFSGLDQLTRNRFLIDTVYFGELGAPSDPKSPSFNQFYRGYLAAQTLFPARFGYTDNLATYDIDPSTVSEDHPGGVPVRKLVDGQPAVAETVLTGNVDLRLSTIETNRGGNISILGPGGNFIAGSVVRTQSQIARRLTAYNVNAEIDFTDLVAGNYAASLGARGLITSIPTGFEGILTLRGGAIRGFTDGSFVLNQSRLFTQGGGNITLWSSNGDLNAGQGPRNASSFPPVVLRFSPNAAAEVDSAGSVSGAGIGAFKSAPSDPEATIQLIAPVGTVDAGDAGVRASGNVLVAAARVANADSFSAGGSISGVPAIGAVAAPATPASAASAALAGVSGAMDGIGDSMAKVARIFVNFLGYSGAETCEDGSKPDADGVCRSE